MRSVYRRLLKAVLQELELIEKQMSQLDQEMADLLRPYHDQVQRLAEVPGLGVDSAQQIMAEVGAGAATFPSGGKLASWGGLCPGEEETAGVNYSRRCPKGNRHLRRILNQAANAAVKLKGSIFEVLYRRYVPRLGHKPTIGVIAHRLCCLIWKILHQGVRYEERGPATHCKHELARRPIYGCVSSQLMTSILSLGALRPSEDGYAIAQIVSHSDRGCIWLVWSFTGSA